METQHCPSYALVYQEMGQTFRDLPINTSEIFCKQLAAFLQGAASRHQHFHHITSISALKSILKSKRWKFGSALKCNDLQEINGKGDKEIWANLFSLSLSHGDEDNVGMWNMYGGNDKPNKVCITLSQTYLSRWKKEIEEGTIPCYRYLQPQKDETVKLKSFGSVSKVSLHDIVYAYGYRNDCFSALHWGNNVLSLRSDTSMMDPSAYASLTSFIKNSAWEYEQETRLTLNVENEQYRLKDIYVGIPDYIFENMIIRLGPYFSQPLLQYQIQDELDTLPANIKNAIISEIAISYFNGRIN